MADYLRHICEFIYKYDIFFLSFFLLMNLITFALFRADKKKAEKNAFRIPEHDLLGFSACLGALGGLLGMVVFHHKTRKPKFFIWVPVFAILQIILLNLVYKWGNV